MAVDQVSRRSLLKTLGVASGAALIGGPLAGCGGGGSGSDSGSGGTFAFMSWDATSDTPLYQVAQNWAEQASREIDVQSVPGGGDYETKLRTVLSSGAHPDVIRINDDFVQAYYSEGSLLDLTPYLEQDSIDADDFYPVAFNFAKQADGAHAAWPILTNPGIIYCNVDAFEEAGVPLPPTDWDADGWTWDDFLDAATKLTKPGGERWGALLFHDTALETVWPVNNGTTGIYSEDAQTFTLADEGSTDALQWAADLALVHGVHPDFGTVSTGKSTPNWAQSLFGTGQVAMLLGLTSSIPYLRENAEVNWDIFPPPQQVTRQTVNTMTVLAVPSESPDPDAAWDFLKYCVGPEAAELFAESRGFVPVATASADLFVADDQAPQNLAMVSQALANAVNENFGLYIERARTVYRPVLDEIWSGRQTAADALGGIRAEVEAILAGQG
nr:extracellular solute-binding protein [Occultella kanbiaonis]